MSCFQCDLDIPHVCYAGMADARWGLGDEAMAALEGAQRNGFMLSPSNARVPSSPSNGRRGRSAKKRRGGGA